MFIAHFSLEEDYPTDPFLSTLLVSLHSTLEVTPNPFVELVLSVPAAPRSSMLWLWPHLLNTLPGMGLEEFSKMLQLQTRPQWVRMYFHTVRSAPPGRFIEQEPWDKMHLHVSFCEILPNSVPEGLCLLALPPAMCESPLPQPYQPSELSHYLISVCLMGGNHHFGSLCLNF